MKEYLGDGVYAEHQGWCLKLTTENGIDVTNTIFLDDSVFEALVEYVKRCNEGKNA